MNLISKLFKSGIPNIFFAESINKIASFLSGIILVRILTKYDYGLYTIENSIFSIAILFAGFGIGSGLLQFCSEKRDENEKKRIAIYCCSFGSLLTLIVCLLMLIYGIYTPFSVRESGRYIIFAFLLPLFYFLFNIVSLFFRAQKRTKPYTYMINSNTISFALLSLVGAFYFGVFGVIIARYLSYFFSFLVGVINLKEDFKYDNYKNVVLDNGLIKDLWRFSITCGVVSAINQLAYFIDVIMISGLIKDPVSVATYKIATVIPENLNFIPNCILIVLIPYYAGHIGEKEWIQTTTKKLLLSLISLNGLICIILYFLAPFVISVLWGNSYSEALTPFRVLCINFFFLGTFRLVGTQILASQRMANVNMWISLATIIFNVIANYFLIKKMGINGAAYATLLVVVFATILQIPSLYRLLK